MDQELIALCAYRLWERTGRPEGRDLEFWLKAERMVSRGWGTRQKATRYMMDDLADAIKRCTECTVESSGELKPVDPIYNVWVAPFNDLVLREKTVPDFPGEAEYKEFKSQYLKTILALAESDWLNSCGLPRSIGMTIQIANTPVGKDPISQMKDKFRKSFYGKVGDTGGMEADQAYWLSYFQLLADFYLKDKENGRDVSFWEKDIATKVGLHLKELGSTDGCSIKRRSHWRDYKRQKMVVIHQIITPTKTFVYKQIGSMDRDRRRLEIFLNTNQASKQYTMIQESRALEKLQKMVTPEQYEQYIITGVIEEVSKRSGVTYFVRKLKPTLAFRKGRRGFNFLAGLCLHPLAYYLDSFSGCLCPTDDVISHLLYIRGDEHDFWAKSNHHPRQEVEAGIP